MTKPWALLLMLLAIAVAWWATRLVDSAPLPTPHAAATSAMEAPPRQPVAVPRSEASVATTLARDGAWWSLQLTANDDEPQAAATDDPLAAVVRGRLTVRQQPWIHPAGVEVRMTRSWLDSVLPVETAETTRAPARNEPTTRTDDEGRFVLHLRPGAGEHFFLIGLGTVWQDFQKVAQLPRPGQEFDLGDVLLDQRGGIAGRVVDPFGWPIAGIEVRAVDEPLATAASGLENASEARRLDLTTYVAKGTMRGGAVPNWVARRDRLLPFPTATSDADGRFELTGLRPGSHDVFVVQNEAWPRPTGGAHGVRVAGGRTTAMGDLRIASREVRLLTFVDEDEKPWVGAEVAIVHGQFGFGLAPQRTSAEGMVMLFPAAVRHGSLLFGLPGGGPWLQLETPPESSSVITVPRPPQLTVLLFDERDRALTGGTVRCFVEAPLFRRVDRALPGGMQPRETKPGSYVGTCPCPMVVVASVPGFAPALARVSPDQPRRTLKLLPMGTMLVHATDLDGRPVADATIRVMVHDNPELRFDGAQWGALANNRVRVGTTDQNGDLTMPVWPATFSLQATHPDFAPSPGPRLVPTPGGRCDLVLRRGGGIHGTLTFQHRAAPRGFRVRARQVAPDGHPLAGNGWLAEHLSVTGDDGTFGFRELCGGLWDLQPELPAAPTASGPRPVTQFASQRLVLDDGQEQHLVLEVQTRTASAATLLGIVRQNGINVAGAVVRLRPRRDEPAADRPRERRPRPGSRAAPDRNVEDVVAEAMRAWSHRCSTDAFGEFRFDELSAGAEFELRVDVPIDGQLQLVHREIVRPGTTTAPRRVDVDLPTGRVLLACKDNGLPVANRMLQLQRRDAKGLELARFDVLLGADGSIDIPDLPAGEWWLQPWGERAECRPESFVLAPARTIAVDVLWRPN